MNRESIATVFLGAVLLPMSLPDATAEPSADGALSLEFVESLRKQFELKPEDRARYNAITSSPIEKLALNREIVRGEDGHFSHRIKTWGITNQKSSGRCWIFAGFNVMRPKVIHDLGLDEFEFSAAYLLFWDKMEKSNLYLEQVIELREAHWLDREWQLINDWMVGDGGWWNYVTSLIDKYGVVPSEVMPETHSSENTGTMNRILVRLLQSRAADLIRASESGGDIGQLRKMKKEAMSEVYRFLALNLGEPPPEFEWRYQTKKNSDSSDSDSKEKRVVEQKQLSELVRFTPQTFYQQLVGVDLSEFVALYHDPAQETGKHYRFSRARNIAGHPEMNFVNVEIELLKEVAVKSILADQPLWFAVNMGVDQSRDHGIMANELFDYESLFGIEMPFTKADRSRFNTGASNHAMVLTGVDLHEGKPVKWLVENSWGEDKGNKGTWTLYDTWFDEHVYNVIVHREHVPEETLAVFEEEAETLPTWYPGAMGIKGRD